MKGCDQAGYWVLLFPDTHERLLLTESPGGPGGPVGPAGPSKPYISKTRSCYKRNILRGIKMILYE